MCISHVGSNTQQPTPKMASNAADETDPHAVNNPSWNMSPNTFPPYLMQLRRWLPYKNSRYNDLVERGVALDRGKVCCNGPELVPSTLQHFAIRQSSKGPLPHLLTFAHSHSLRPPAAPSSATAPSAAPATATPSSASTSPPAPATSVRLSLPSDRHIDFPDAILLIDNSMYNDILSTFSDEDYKDQLEKDHAAA